MVPPGFQSGANGFRPSTLRMSKVFFPEAEGCCVRFAKVNKVWPGACGSRIRPFLLLTPVNPFALPPTNMEPDRESLKENGLPGPCQVPCSLVGGYLVWVGSSRRRLPARCGPRCPRYAALVSERADQFARQGQAAEICPLVGPSKK